MFRLLFLPVVLLAIHPALGGAPKYPPPTEVKAAFKKLLDRSRVPLDVKAGAIRTLPDGMIAGTLSFACEKKSDNNQERVPVLIIRPAVVAQKLPAVIVLHGTGGNKESQQGFMIELVKRGMIAVAIDARYHGARSGGAKGSAAYVAAATRAWRTPAGQPHEHPFLYDTCWDLWRLVDYLETRQDVDASRLGMIGFSMGGIETYLAASVDERIKVAVPVIAVQSFRWSLENERWMGRTNTIRGANEAAAKDLGEPKVNQRVCRALWAKLLPGVLEQFDCPSMLRLFAGRPLLVLSTELDGNCPLPGAKLAFAQAEQAFKEAGCPEKLRIDVALGKGHTTTPQHRQLALEWLERWLVKE